ncbi:UPF0146 family protein [Halorussus lipolyticus]|uniref:UPF0146 family protein n=1 Tax=Halorussus lipolyticus TaxID=3034024 RepID=UPI0023E76D75|nr:UPF0146 family protein [Halorussus sp. DT80]
MRSRTRQAVVARLAVFDTAVEVGIGNRTDVAGALADEDTAVTATDVHQREVPEEVHFERDDVLDPDPEIYRDADVLYALNLPPELHRPALEVARSADAAFLFTTLGGDQPAIPVERETVPGETIFVARE